GESDRSALRLHRTDRGREQDEPARSARLSRAVARSPRLPANARTREAASSRHALSRRRRGRRSAQLAVVTDLGEGRGGSGIRAPKIVRVAIWPEIDGLVAARVYNTRP